MRIEGQILGFDEYMNLVLDEAEEVRFFCRDEADVFCFFSYYTSSRVPAVCLAVNPATLYCCLCVCVCALTPRARVLCMPFFHVRCVVICGVDTLMLHFLSLHLRPFCMSLYTWVL